MVPVFSTGGSGEVVVNDVGTDGIAITGDFNGDGFADAIATQTSAQELVVLLSDGVAGRPTLNGTQRIPTGNQPRQVLVSDLNGDDQNDIAVPNLFSNDVYVSLGRSDGSFDAPETLAVGGSGPTAIAQGDLDGDGVTDLVTANAFSNDVTLLLGDGTGKFAFKANVPTGDLPLAIEIADINGDGLLDILTASSVPTASRGTGLTLLLGDGSGGFQATQLLPAPSQSKFPFAQDTWLAADLAVADINDDDQLDVVLVRANEPNVTVLMSSQRTGLPTVRRDFRVGRGPRQVELEDFNEDGQIDIAVLNAHSNEVSILLGMGSPIIEDPGELGGVGFPRFARAVNYLTPPGPGRLIIDRDIDPGKLHAFVSGAASADSGASASFSMTASGVTLPPEIASVVPSSGPPAGGTRIELKGLNFQSGARVFVDGLEATGVLVNPQNTIEASTPAAAAGSGGSVEVRVINPDGRIATRPGGYTYELTLTEPLSFTRLAFCNDGVEPAGLPNLPDCAVRIFKDAAVGDFNGNGLLDVFAASADSTTASDQVYRNTGTRTFHQVTRGNGTTGFLAAGLFVPKDVASPGPQPRYDVQPADFALLGTGEFTDRRLDIVSVDGFQVRLLVNTGNDSDSVPIFDDQADTRLYANTTDVDLAWSAAVFSQCSLCTGPGGIVDQACFNDVRDNDFNSFVWDDIDVGDLDLDGDLDIALANRNRETCFNQGPGRAGGRGTFILINNDGSGNFDSVALPLTNVRADHDVEMADIDNDCDADLVFSGHSGTPPSAPVILRNNIRSSCTAPVGTLSFTDVSTQLNSELGPIPAEFNYVGAETPSGPLDVNEDGFVDLHFGGDQERLFLNRGSAEPGVFDEVVWRNRTSPGDQDEPLFPTGAFMYGGNYGDLDLDGKIDIVSGDYRGRPTVLLNQIPPGSTRAQIEAMSEPFEELPERTGFNGRGDPGDLWPSMNPMQEPDVGEARPGLPPVPVLDPDGVGRLTVPHGPQMGVEVHDLDNDNDPDVLFSYGDGGQNRINRVFLNNHRAEDAGVGPTRGRNAEGREILHWRDAVSFSCFNLPDGSITQVRLRLFPEEDGGAPPIDETIDMAAAQAANIDSNGDGVFDFVFTIPELFPRHGNTVVSFEYQVVTSGGVTLTLQKSQNIFIDPSGIVTDAETFAPIINARVDLEVQNISGNWITPAIAEIRPQINPQSTGTDGGYGWDVVPGRYRVIVTANGYEDAISREVVIPPEVTDLDVSLTSKKVPKIVLSDRIRFHWYHWLWPKWIKVELTPEIRQELATLAGGGEIRFAEATPGSKFMDGILNWPLDEYKFELDPNTGTLMTDLKIRQVFGPEEPFFVGLLDVFDSRGSRIAELWLDLEFRK